MKRIILFTSIILCLSGCAYFTEHLDNGAACLADPACKETVQGRVNVFKEVAGATGIPFASAGVGALGTFLLLFFAKKKGAK